MWNEKSYLIHLIKGVLCQTPFEEKPEEVDWQQLFILAREHNVESMVFAAIKQLSQQPEPPLKSHWQKCCDGNMIKSLYQEQTFTELEQLFVSEGIDYMPLKGLVLLPLYPRQDYRYLGDLDILFRPKQLEEAHQKLVEQGFTREKEALAYHTVYHKNIMGANIILEAHRILFDEKLTLYSPFFEQIWAISSPKQDNRHRYEMPLNYQYLYLLTHFAKHYFGQGSGLRPLLDLYLFRKQYGQELDEAWLLTSLTALELDQFAQLTEDLLEVWFGDGLSGEEINMMAEYVFNSGSYGSLEQGIQNQIAKMGTSTYILQRLFPDKETLKKGYAVLNRHNFPYPIAWLIRAVAICRHNSKGLKDEVRYLYRRLRHR